MDYQGLRRGRRLAAVLVSLVLVVAMAGAVHAQESESNLDLMTSLTEEVAVELLSALDEARAGRALRLVSFANSEEYRFLEKVFTTVLTDRGVQLYRTSAAPEATETQDDALELHLQATEFSVAYPKIFRSYLMGGKKVRRTANIALVATLIDPDTGAVLRVEEGSRGAADVVLHGDLRDIEEGTFEFVRPPVPPTGWARAVEPVFVSGIIVGLIYLFFSNQSD
jgi:hypothetical protein